MLFPKFKVSGLKYKGLMLAIIVTLAVASFLSVYTAGATGTTVPQAKNVILLVGDGMSLSTVTAARLFKAGVDGSLYLDTLPYRNWASTHSLNSLATDSAAAGTALATGRKTNNGMVSMLPDHTELVTILDIARQMRKSTGLVATTEITHATPAAFGAKTSSRNNLVDIARQYLTRSQVDVLLGGGLRVFQKEDLLPVAKEQRYTVVSTAAELEALDSARLFSAGQKILGLFAEGHLAFELDRPTQAPGQPHLMAMTKAALAYLSQDQDGFFLMVEGGRIDHAQHGNDAARTIHDTVAFDQAVKVALDFQRANPDTLVVVTSDHDTGGMAVEWPRNQLPQPGELPVVDIDLDRLARGMDMTTRELLTELERKLSPEVMHHVNRLLWRDGVWTSGDHTAVDVPVLAAGPGAQRLSERGRMDLTDVFQVMEVAKKGSGN
ncbi:MAG: Alkaline phosphatase 4 [Syntrophomonadaceae bacterium]|nr:Alkaline phosphatase 4 [Bacillota bacterium]